MSANLPPESKLRDLTRYVYGTTRLGDEKIPFGERVAIARKAIDAGLSLHTSDQYGDALNVLDAAFDIDRANIPPLIFKIGWESLDQVRGQILKQLESVGLETMTVGQLCLGGQLAEDFASNGAGIDQLNSLKEEGLVGSFVVEVFPWTSQVPLTALAAGYSSRLIDAHIFYLNPLQRFATNDLWDLLMSSNQPIVAMRTVGGGTVYPGPKAASYLRDRAVEVAPIFEASGCASWTEFCVRFALGIPQVVATVGATGSVANLDAFIAVAHDPQPLPAETYEQIFALQRRWSDEVDRHAEPWTM